MTEDLSTVLRRNLRNHLRSRNLREAGEVLERLRDLDPLSPATRELELEYLVRMGRSREADILGRRLLEQFPQSSIFHYLGGHVAYSNKDYSRAVQYFREAQHLQPHWKYRRWLGKALTQKGELDEAEALLLELSAEGREFPSDLAWLYERKGDLGRAIALLEQQIKQHPDDAFLKDQLQRLRVRELDPEEVQEEMELMQALGEGPPEEMIPEYVRSLLTTGQGAKARDYVSRESAAWSTRTLRSVAWDCHHLQAYDLATPLFLEVFSEEKHNVKFLAALEKAADRCGKLEELIAHLEAHAPEDKRLYGRLNKLLRRLPPQ